LKALLNFGYTILIHYKVRGIIVNKIFLVDWNWKRIWAFSLEFI